MQIEEESQIRLFSPLNCELNDQPEKLSDKERDLFQLMLQEDIEEEVGSQSARSETRKSKVHAYFLESEELGCKGFQKQFRHPFNNKLLNSSSGSSLSQETERKQTPQNSFLEEDDQYPMHEEVSFKRKQYMVSSQSESDQCSATEIGCSCKKTKCLKMYCDCFANRVLCNSNCSCLDCGNSDPNSTEHQQAILDALSRNSRAFRLDAGEQSTKKFSLGIQQEDIRKGCKCRRTKCLKKYCECLSSGSYCSQLCKCESCENKPSKQC